MLKVHFYASICIEGHIYFILHMTNIYNFTVKILLTVHFKESVLYTLTKVYFHLHDLPNRIFTRSISPNVQIKHWHCFSPTHFIVILIQIQARNIRNFQPGFMIICFLSSYHLNPLQQENEQRLCLSLYISQQVDYL